MNRIFIAAFAAVSLGGCDEDVVNEPESGVVDNTEVSDEVTFRRMAPNGTQLNGAKFNGAKFNGAKFNGAKFNGAKFNGAKFNGTAFGGSLNNVALGAWTLEPGTSKLRATGANNTIYAGNGLKDSEQSWEADDENGNPTTQKLRVDLVTQSSEDPEVYFTKLSFEVSEGMWDSFCKDGANNPTEAIAVPGHFDAATASWEDDGSGAISFACRGTAAGKCIEWSYKMWSSYNGTPLRDYYKACTRMVRADYCGNNVTHTTNGTAIDVSDVLGRQVSETNWAVEAKWGPNGAVCINEPRKLANTRAQIVAECQAAGRGTLPTCDQNETSQGGSVLTTRSGQT